MFSAPPKHTPVLCLAFGVCLQSVSSPGAISLLFSCLANSVRNAGGDLHGPSSGGQASFYTAVFGVGLLYSCAFRKEVVLWTGLTPTLLEPAGEQLMPSHLVFWFSYCPCCWALVVWFHILVPIVCLCAWGCCYRHTGSWEGTKGNLEKLYEYSI